MPKRFQIKLSLTSCVLSMPPNPSFSISTPLIFGNSSLCNFQLLFSPNLPFTGLNFVLSSIYQNPKRKRLQKQNTATVHTSSPATQRHRIWMITKRGTNSLSHAIMRSRDCLVVPLFPVPENNYTIFMKTYNTSKWPSGRIAPSGKHHFPHNHRTREKAFKIPSP